MSQMSQGDGNTKVARNRSRTWVFTLNNYTEDELSQCLNVSGVVAYAMQEESGHDEKTPHIQGYLEFKNQIDFNTIKKLLPRAHIEKCKDKKASIAYCTKEDTRTGRVFTKGVKIIQEVRDPIIEPREWQQEAIMMLTQPPNDRTINWWVDIEGGKGKTALCKHLCLKHKALYLNGKCADMKYAIAEWLKQGNDLNLIVIDYTRSMEQFVSYQGLEEIKNGIFFSTKYESGMVMYNSPHVFVFSNFYPDQSKLSEDRWNIKCI